MDFPKYHTDSYEEISMNFKSYFYFFFFPIYCIAISENQTFFYDKLGSLITYDTNQPNTHSFLTPLKISLILYICEEGFMKRFLLLVFTFFLVSAGIAQQGPVYGQYFHNPFLYNPGFAGAEMQPLLVLTHQRRMLGIEDAPVASTAVFHTPLSKKFAAGAKIYTESQGLLTSSSAQLALVYVLPLSGATSLRFGLAGGATKNQLDLSTASDAQMAYLSDLSTSFSAIDIRCGLVLNSRKLQAGISFPNISRRSIISATSFQEIEVDPLEHMVFTGSYKADLVPGRLMLEPVLIFERFNSSQEQRIEAGALLHIKELIWVGSTYQYNNGISGLLGIKVKNYVSFGYAYEFNTNVTSLFKNASHEVQLKIRLGKEKQFNNEPKKHTPRFEQSGF